MENKIENKYSKISTNFDDIKIRKVNYYFKPPPENENDIKKSFQKQNALNFGNSIAKQFHSIIDKTNALLNIKLGSNKKFEERKNIENENNGFSHNKFKILNEKNNNNNNLKNILSQNKKIINEINSIINNEKEPKYESNYLKNNSINNYYSSNINNKDKEINDYNENKRKGKTFFNYNEELQNQIGWQDKYFNNIEKYTINGNNKINDKNKNNSTFDSINNNKIISKFNFGKNKIDLNNIYNHNTNINKNNSNNLANTELNDMSAKILSNYNQKEELINKEYHFNYGNEDSLKKINKALIKSIPVINNYKKEQNANSILDNKVNINENIKYDINSNYYLKQNKGLKFNNYLNNNDMNIVNNIENKSIYNIPDSDKNFEEKEKQIKIQIENEERNLLKLEEEKNQLIKEEKERRQILYNELSNRENNYSCNENENLTEIKNRPEKDINNKYLINSITDKNLDISKKNYINNDNYYKDFLKEIRDRNEMINKNNLETINNNNINKENDHYEKININEISALNNKSLSVEKKKTEIKDYNINSYNKTNNTLYNKIYNSENEYNSLKVNKKRRYASEKRYNINSYFQIKDKGNYTNININNNGFYNNKFNKNKSEQSLSSYIDETSKENNEIIGQINNSNNNQKCKISLTPNALYRNHNTDNNNIFNRTNLRINPDDNLLLNKNYNFNYSKYRNGAIKTFNTNNCNTMTQTRYYRNKEFSDKIYENNQLRTLNTMKDYKNKFSLINNISHNFKKQNSSRTLSNLNFDIDKDYINKSYNYNYIPNSQNNTIINKNNHINNSLSINTRNSNNLYSTNYSNRINSNRCKCILKKGRSYSDISKIIEPINKIETINTNSNSLLRNYRNTYNKNIGYEFSSKNIRRNNYNNLVYNTFNQNNNSFNNRIGNFRNICGKCAKKHFLNETNHNFFNTFRNYNSLRLCTTCKKLLGDNGNKLNNWHFIK